MYNSKKIFCCIISVLLILNLFTASIFASAVDVSAGISHLTGNIGNENHKQVIMPKVLNRSDKSDTGKRSMSLKKAVYESQNIKQLVEQSLPEINIYNMPDIIDDILYFSCEPVDGADTYSVIISKSKDFTNPEYILKDVDYTDFSISLADFESSGTWYAYVFAFSNGKLAAFSKDLEFDIPDDYSVDFQNDEFERVIRNKLDKPTGEILKSELDKITELDAQNKGISSLYKIRYLSNLEKLNMRDNVIKYADDLYLLKKLSVIDLSNNFIGSLEPFVGMTCIKELHLSGNIIRNIDVTGMEATIEKLYLDSNLIKDISALGSYTNLKSLFLADNFIFDYSQVAGYYGKLEQKDFSLAIRTPAVSEPVQFSDINLEKAVRDNIIKPTGDIYADELASITALYASNISITDLNGIQYLKNLRILDLSDNNIDDLKPLAGLSRLKVLGLTYSNIKDINPLSSLGELNELELSDNQISDISVLKKLSKINLLNINNNNINSLEALRGALNNLIELRAYNNQISDITPVLNHNDMLDISLEDNKITDISGLGDLHGLKGLRLDNNTIAPSSFKELFKLTDLELLSVYNIGKFDFGGLAGLKNLGHLNIGSNGITDIGFLSKLTNLNDLCIAENNISSIKSLRDLKRLFLLYLGNNNITDISVLSGLVELAVLDLSGNRIVDISSINGLTDLRALGISNNQIVDISPISGLTGLNWLDISNNRIVDISPISGLTGLNWLYISNNQIVDIKPISGLTGLERLDISNNRISDITALSNLNKLDSLYLMNNRISDFKPVESFYNNLKNKDFVYPVIPVSGLKIRRQTINIEKNNQQKVLTKAMFCDFLVKYFDLKDDPTKKDPVFSDVSASDESYRNICIVYKNGIFTYSNYEEKAFKPNNPVTRAAYATVIVRLLKYKYTSNTKINDISDQLYEKYIETAVDAGLISLKDDNNFKQDESMLLDCEAQLIPVISPVDASNKRVIWSSSDENVATVDQTGHVTGVNKGTAKIFAETEAGNIKVECTVNVSAGESQASPTSVPTKPVNIDPGPVGNPPGGNPPPAETITPTPTTTITPTPTAAVTPTPTKTVTEVATKIPAIDGFKDIKGHWAEANIIELLDKGIITGYPDGTVKPDSEVTRAEITVMLAKAAGLKAAEAKLPFKDAKDIPDWAAGYIQAAFDKGVIKGFDDGDFKAANKLSRKEIVVMAMRAFALGESSEKLDFADSKDIPKWAAGSIAKAVELGITKGYGDNTFKPNKNVTRAEVITIIAKCLKLKGN